MEIDDKEKQHRIKAAGQRRTWEPFKSEFMKHYGKKRKKKRLN